MQIQKNADFVKDTFAKFGLNMNLYNPHHNEGFEGFGTVQKTEEEIKKQKIKDFLDALPDYGFLTETKLAIPKELFVE